MEFIADSTEREEKLKPFHQIYSTLKTTFKTMVHSLDDFGNTPLHLAAAAGIHQSSIETLLQNGANPNVQREKDGFTPLHIAIKYGHLPTVKALLACPETNIELCDTSGQTPIVLAALLDDEDSLDIINALVKHQVGLTGSVLYGSSNRNTKQVPANQSGEEQSFQPRRSTRLENKRKARDKERNANQDSPNKLPRRSAQIRAKIQKV